MSHSPYSLTGVPAAPTYSLLGDAPAHQPHYSLLGGASLSNAYATQDAAAAYFGVASGSELSHGIQTQPKIKTLDDFLERGQPDPDSTKLKLLADLAADAAHVKDFKKAVETGKKLHDASKAIEASSSKTEEAVCQTVKFVAEKTFGTVTKGPLVAGVPLYVAGVAADPLLLVTLPLVVEELPIAYKNADALSKFAGEKAEADCHLLFSGTK